MLYRLAPVRASGAPGAVPEDSDRFPMGESRRGTCVMALHLAPQSKSAVADFDTSSSAEVG
jgi:hypothetical protein